MTTMSIRPQRRDEEIELKLALPTDDPASLAKRLSRTSVLARRKPTRLHLYNIYYDTPDQMLRQQRIALRLRRIDSDQKPKWVQTLKTGGGFDSALSQRGEWEKPVNRAALSWQALQDTPWKDHDPAGAMFQALTAVFVTSFERTLWLVRRRNGSVVEVALDIGEIVVGNQSTPIFELELELKVGQPTALFDIGQEITRTIAVLPMNQSKAERGYALAQDGVGVAVPAKPRALTLDLPLPATAQRVLLEMFCQFTSNLNTLCRVDDPEVVHQARIGWRRFKSAWHFFRPVLANKVMPCEEALQPLLTGLSQLRDLDVARTETLPAFAHAYAANNSQRAARWQAMTLALMQAAQRQLKTVQEALQAPAVGASLLATTQWLQELTPCAANCDALSESKDARRNWLKRRIRRLHKQLKLVCKEDHQPNLQHRARILAKRMRYSIEILGPHLPKKRTQRWYRQATALQTRIGAKRDVMQAAALVAALGADHGLVKFLRRSGVG